jgi:membrane protein implicated in regulation of membrane protease activity
MDQILLAVGLALIVSIVSPLLVARQTNKATREAQRADWEREDLVAARLQAAGDVTNGKLDVIHTLVNSNMTAAMEDALGSKVALLVALRRMAGALPSADEQDLINTTEAEIAERRAELHDRQQQAAIVLAHEKAGGE